MLRLYVRIQIIIYSWPKTSLIIITVFGIGLNFLGKHLVREYQLDRRCGESYSCRYINPKYEYLGD